MKYTLLVLWLLFAYLSYPVEWVSKSNAGPFQSMLNSMTYRSIKLIANGRPVMFNLAFYMEKDPQFKVKFDHNAKNIMADIYTLKDTIPEGYAVVFTNESNFVWGEDK